jgi:glycosyltransferase involved in cell wall biosynthesis
MTNPLISVIIAVKNGTNYIKEAIDGIKKQNMNVEIIVVDDGSDDNTGELVKKLGGCKIFRNEKSIGQSGASNIALHNAKGDFILFHDHDDVMRDGVLIKMYKEFEKNKDTLVVQGKCKDFFSPELRKEDREKIQIQRKSFYGLLTGATLFRKEVFDIVGYFDTSIPTTAVFPLELQKHNIEVKKINIISTNRRVHNTNYGRVDKKQEYKNYLTSLRKGLINHKK